jgi:hypothetical protein
MNCGGVRPDKSWWTVDRIIGISVGGSVAVLILIFVIGIFMSRKPSRSGYTEIDGVDDPLPNAPIAPSNELLFPPYGEEDDALSAYSAAVSRHTTASQAPTLGTTAGVSVMDDNRI